MKRTTEHTKTRTSTHTTDSVSVTWDDKNYKCCGQVVWPKGTDIDVWDESGLGDWAARDRRQCGTCGQLVGPRSKVTVRP